MIKNESTDNENHITGKFLVPVLIGGFLVVFIPVFLLFVSYQVDRYTAAGLSVLAGLIVIFIQVKSLASRKGDGTNKGSS